MSIIVRAYGLIVVVFLFDAARRAVGVVNFWSKVFYLSIHIVYGMTNSSRNVFSNKYIKLLSTATRIGEVPEPPLEHLEEAEEEPGSSVKNHRSDRKMDGFLKPFLPICSVDVWLSRYAHFYQHLLKKFCLRPAQRLPGTPTFFRQQKSHERSHRMKDCLRMTSTCSLKVMMLARTLEESQRLLAEADLIGCFWSGIYMGMAWPFPPPAKLTYC